MVNHEKGGKMKNHHAMALCGPAHFTVGSVLASRRRDFLRMATNR
jgi:hypothetical protein